MEKIVLCCKYFRYLHKTYTTVFNIIYEIKQTEVVLCSDITTKTSLFGYVIYYSVDTHCWQCVSAEQ